MRTDGRVVIPASVHAYIAVSAAVDVEIGERRPRAVGTTAAIAVVGVGAGVKWADRIGPAAYLLLAVVIGLGFLYFRNQPDETKESIKKLAGAVGNKLLKAPGEQSSTLFVSVDNRPFSEALWLTRWTLWTGSITLRKPGSGVSSQCSGDCQVPDPSGHEGGHGSMGDW